MILPLLLLLAGILTAGHRPSCTHCKEMCSLTASSDNALCKCDADCQVFGDCCGNQTPPSSCPTSQLPLLQDGVMLDCISTYLNPNIPVLADNIAFLMVSTCPHSWIEAESGITRENCTSPNLATTLPPVTSTATGMVYRNEYCALCNAVRELVAWQTDLVCNQRVYNLLTHLSISNILLNEPDIFQSECHDCAFHIPSTITHGNTPLTRNSNTAPRSCIPRVRNCLPHKLLEIKSLRTLKSKTYALMKEKCTSGMLDLVMGTGSGAVYHNTDCAVCNAENTTECFFILPDITNRIPDLCFPGAETATTTITTTPAIKITPRFDSPFLNQALPFTITLSNLGQGTVSISTNSDSTSISLDCPEGTAPVGLQCRPTQCPEGYSEMGGRCSYVFPSPPNLHPSNFTTKNCSIGILVLNETGFTDLGNDTIILEEDNSKVIVMDYDEFGRPIICIGNVSFLDCSTALVPLNGSEYLDLGNNSIAYKNETVQVIFYDKHGRPLICPDSITATIITTTIQLLATLPGLQELTYVGCSLSILGAIMILFTYTVFSELRTFPGVVLMNLCSSILATSLIFITGGPVIQKYPVKELCSSLAIVLHFSYLSQFMWMSIFSFEIVKNFYQAKQLVMALKKTKQKFFVAYLCIGWCLPLLVTATCIMLNFSTEGLVLYGVNRDKQMARCWINHFESFIITFLIPLILSLSCNLVMFLYTTFLLCRFSRDQSKLETSNMFTLIRVWLAILSTTGLTWIFGFVAILDQESWMWYPFVIFNSTQGLSMFLAFIFTKKILRLYLDSFARKQLKKHPPTSTKMSKMPVNSATKKDRKECTISASSFSCGEILGKERISASNNGANENGVDTSC